MYTLRMMAVAVLFHGDDMLMMKRSPDRTLSPGKWAGIGGHMEPDEIRNPRQACLREVEEETGLRSVDIPELHLRYILLRLNGNELRQQFVYFGRVSRRDVSRTDEGELFWIPREEILNRDIPFVFRSVLEHWLTAGPAPHLWMATAGLFDDTGTRTGPNPRISFIPVTDPGMV